MPDCVERRLMTPKESSSALWRQAVAVALGLLTISYLLALVLGYVPLDRRIDLAALGTLVFFALCIAFLLQPQFIERLSSLEFAGLKLQVRELARNQDRQERRIDGISTLLPLVLPKPERENMLNLFEGKTANYAGNSNLRRELRRLRSIQIIESLPNRHIAELTSGQQFDLSQHVRLTPLGREWIKIMQEYEKAPEE
jgi:hypothetical protein